MHESSDHIITTISRGSLEQSLSSSCLMICTSDRACSFGHLLVCRWLPLNCSSQNMLDCLIWNLPYILFTCWFGKTFVCWPTSCNSAPSFCSHGFRNVKLQSFQSTQECKTESAAFPLKVPKKPHQVHWKLSAQRFIDTNIPNKIEVNSGPGIMFALCNLKPQVAKITRQHFTPKKSSETCLKLLWLSIHKKKKKKKTCAFRIFIYSFLMHHFPHAVSLTCTLEAENLVSSCFPCIDMCLGAGLSARISQAGGRVPWLRTLTIWKNSQQRLGHPTRKPHQLGVSASCMKNAKQMQSVCFAQLLPPSIAPLHMGFDRGPFLWWTGRYFFCNFLPETNFALQ